MATTVEIGVYLTTADAPYFRIGNAVKGRLNNASYRLAGPIFYDITDKVQSVSTKRGKNRELDRYSAGNASVVLNNEDRAFDPLNTSSIFYGNIIPRRQIRIRTGGFDQFNGVVEDWNLDYDVAGKSNATVIAADGFTLLAQQTLTPGTATTQKTGARINAVLDQPTVAWPTNQRSIDAGNNTVGADVFDGNVLSYLQDVENSEQGQLFIDRAGNVRFVNGAATPTSGSNVLVSTNLVTNPSMEATNGYTTVRTNLLTNPSFEVNTAGWTGNNLTTFSRSTAQAYTGTYSFLATSNGGSGAGVYSPRYAVSPNGSYTFSFYVRDVNTAQQFQASLVWYTATSGGTEISVNVGTATTVSSSGWTRVSVIGTAPATANAALVFLGAAGVHTAGTQFYLDAGLFEASSTLGDFFDGSFNPAGDFSFAWTGTANASTSIARGASVVGATGNNLSPISSNMWASTGSRSIRTIPTSTTSNDSWTRFNVATNIGTVYTASVKIRLAAPQSGSLHADARKMLVFNSPITALLGTSSAAPNTAGVTTISVTFTATTTTSIIHLANGALSGNGDIYFDDLLVEASPVVGAYFDGSTTDSMPYSYRWTGLENASTSVKELSTLPLFSDADDGIPYTNIAVSYGTELLFNQASVTSPAGTAIANNTVSQSKYGITQTTVNTLLSNTTDTSNLAAFTVAKYGEPEYRFENLEITLNGLTGTQKNQVLQLELGDIIQVKFTPNKVGSSIQRYGQIISINNSIGPSEHKIVYGIGSVQYSFLVLDDVGFGILDTNALAF